MMFFLSLLFLALSGASAQIAEEDIPLIDDINIPAYLGRFYQTHASPVILGSFERDGVCITATYGFVNASTISVYNHMLLFTPDGTVSDIDGFGVTTEDPAKLNVYLAGVPTAGEYWIMELGPLRDYEGSVIQQYAYALVTDSRGLSLFVLARDVAEFEAEFEDDALARLAEIGFVTELNKPVKTYHGADCDYPL